MISERWAEKKGKDFEYPTMGKDKENVCKKEESRANETYVHPMKVNHYTLKKTTARGKEE